MRLEDQIGLNERVLWSGTKDKKVSFWESIFNSMLPFAVLWSIIDFTFIGGAIGSMRNADVARGTYSFLVPFFLLHLMPVWMYLGGVLTSVRKAENTRYCITDQAVYIQSGILNTTVTRKEYSHFTALAVSQSFWDKRAGTGDVRITLDEIYYSGKHHRRHHRMHNIENIADYEAVFRLVQQYYNASKFNEAAAAVMQTGYPSYGNPPVTPYGYPQMQQYGNPQMQQYVNPQMQQYANPQAPQYGYPQPAAPEMAELVTPPAQDDFVDPTLAAFDFQNQNPDGDDSAGSGF